MKKMLAIALAMVTVLSRIIVACFAVILMALGLRNPGFAIQRRNGCACTKSNVR